MINEVRKPQISILMAVYEPNMEWLRQQLLSLNAQNYPRLHLYLREDCSPTIPFDGIEHMVEECITAFPFTITRNEKNCGSNTTFERLTQEAEGELFAYCDQDDIWFPKKLDILQQDMERENALLVCSDMYVINGEGRRIADSIRDVRKHHILLSGDGLAESLLTHNFVTGCTVLVDAKTAKEATPFCPEMVHDHYLALYCASRGKIYSEPAPTICYRQHGNNQTGLLIGVQDKTSYGCVRIDESVRQFEWLKERFAGDPALRSLIDNCLVWAKARQRHWRDRSGKKTLWKYRHCNKTITYFELLTVSFPENLFMRIVRLNRKNII